MKLWCSLVLIAALVFATRAAPLSAQPPGQTASIRVDSVHVTGNLRQATPVILADLGIRPGDQVTAAAVRRGIKRLFNTGQYHDIRVYAVGLGLPGSTTTLIVEVVERPLIVQYDFRGLEHIGAGAIRDSVGLESDSPLDPSQIHEVEQQIRAGLAGKGYVRASVDTTLIETERAGEFRLVLNVDEGRRLVVSQIVFEGNEGMSDAEIAAGMLTKSEAFWWWRSGELRQEDYDEDLDVSLAERYGELGYLDFKVIGDSIVVDPVSGKTRLEIQVEEGKRYRVADFQIEGNTHFPTEVLAARFNLSGGGSLLSGIPLVGGGSDDGRDPVFNTRIWREATQDIETLYRNAGYLYSRIEPVVERLDDGEDGDPRVRLIWRIEENQQAYVNLITIAGNTITHERVIRERLVLLPGDVYSDDRIVQSYQTIQGLGFFTPLPPQEALEVAPNEEGNLDVSFKVSEKQTGNVNFGASLAPSSGLAGFIGYEQPNLFGQAKSGRFRWTFGARQNDIEVSYSDPSVFGSRKSMGISLRNARDRFSFVGLGQRRQLGGTVSLGTPFFASRWTRVSVVYGLFRDEFDSDEGDLDLAQRELLSVGTRSSLELRLTRDTRNHPLFPTNGSRVTIAGKQVGGPLGGDGNYQQFRFEGDWFTPIAQLRTDPTKTPIMLVLGLSTKAGAIFGDNPFFHERFFMGGVQYGIPLRGYSELEVTPSGHVPRSTPGFNQLDRVGESFFSVSTQIALALSSAFVVRVFYDAGNVWGTAQGFNPTDLLRGVGVGASLVSPLGPIGVDYAYGVDRRGILGLPNPGWKLHFRFGQLF